MGDGERGLSMNRTNNRQAVGGRACLPFWLPAVNVELLPRRREPYTTGIHALQVVRE